ncbi:hypothetical protein KFL_003010010 [Klebsormidium nitens]|uniref:SF3 helicase domain-containing protein n=1 Tax=Klebsormidium nitens TaxID=105231 RepID=A0A1Y1I6P1_KLENI|nr:hypothetical protein KFL_003010010 [Klebsormidium nitens]|eukprot:GAQ86625.1 hypothetical protein KFL_003010010 [Klebsormidium nitens]
MIASPPSSYQRGEEVARYTVAGGGDLPAVDALPPLPGWFIEILNERASSKAAGASKSRPGAGKAAAAGAGITCAPASVNPPDLADPVLQHQVVEIMRGMLSSYGDNSSVFRKPELSTIAGSGAVMYHFENGPGGRATCPYLKAGEQAHRSNKFGLFRRGTEITYVCHSERCKGEGRRNKKLGRLPFPVAAAFSDAEPLNSERDRLYEDRQLLPLSFLRENLSIAAGDEGGAQIIDRLQTYTGHKLVYSNEKWYYWTGSVWMADPGGREAQKVCRGELNKISAAYQKETGAAIEQDESEEDDGSEERTPKRKKKKTEKLTNFSWNARMSNIMTTLKGYCLDAGFEKLLNSNRDALPLLNGVILLPSAELVPHHPKFLWSFMLGYRWPSTGVHTPLGRMGEFLREIMHTPEALAYLQRILGYGITGHISNQVMLIMIGEGGAGKSLLLTLLKRLIGPFYKDVSKDMLVTSKGQRPPSKGSASPDEAGLQGVRMAVCLESEETDEFAESNLKRLTGEATITSRALYRDYVTFETTQLHILCTNYPPRAKRWTIALKRRLLTLVFPMRFFYPEEAGYNPRNPLHGVRDDGLESILMAEVEKLLVFLVIGAKDWYQNGRRLLDMPETSKRYMESWEQSNDPFAAFLKNEGTIDIKAFETSESLMAAYNNPNRLVDGVRFEDTGAPPMRTTQDLAKSCRAHGMEGPGKPSESRLVDAGHQIRGYRGWRLNE